MNAQLIGRVVWKEYRLQRKMWLLLALIALAIQVVIVVGNAGDDLRDKRDTVDAVVTAGLLFSMLAGLVQCATSFSSECEDRTQIRLLSFGASPWSVLSVKLIFALLVISIWIAIMLLLSTVMTGESSFKARVFQHQGIVPYILIIALSTTTLGLFFSLLFRSSVTALASTLVAEGFVIVTLTSYRFFLNPGICCIIAFTSIAGFAGIDFLLVKRWFQFPKQPTHPVRAIIADATETIVKPARTLGELDGEKEVRQSLIQLSQKPMNRVTRYFQFLCWKEITETRPHFFVVLAILAFCVVNVAAAGNPVNWVSLPVMAFMNVSFFLGLATFRSEQRQSSFRFLTNQGIHPSIVWSSKLSVWLFRAAVCFIVLILGTAWTADGVIYDEFVRAAGFLKQGHGQSGMDVLIHLMMVGGLLFGAGQLGSICSPRFLHTLVLGLLIVFPAITWLLFTQEFEIPDYITLLPIVFSLYVVTFLRTRNWLLEQDSFKAWKRPLIGAATGLGVTLTLTMCFRAFEIPATPPHIEFVGTERITNGVTDEQRLLMTADLSSEERETAKLLLDAGKQMVRKNADIGDLATPHRWDDWKQEDKDWLAENQPAVDLLVRAAKNKRCAFGVPADQQIDDRDRLPRSIARQAIRLLILSASKLQMDGDNAAALNRLNDALRVCRHSEGRGSVATYDAATDLLHVICVAFHQWSSVETVTRQQRAAGKQMLDAYHESMPPIGLVFANEFRAYQNSVTDFEFVNDRSRGGWQSVVLWFAFYLPGEQTRLDRFSRIAASIEAENLAYFTSQRDADSGQIDFPTSWDRELGWPTETPNSKLARWHKTTLLARIYRPPSIRIYTTALRRDTHLAATRLILRLHDQAFSNNDAQLPRQVGETRIDERDPWDKSDFTFLQAGIDERLEFNGEQASIPAKQPFIFSRGVGNFEFASTPRKDSKEPGKGSRELSYHVNNDWPLVYVVPMTRTSGK